MTGRLKFVVDTSFVVALLKGAVESSHSLHEVGFPVAVVGELRFGALGSRAPARRLAEIERLFGGASILASDVETARVYAEVRHRLKSAGRPLPENDIWIAATCLQYGLPLLTLDRHFNEVEGLDCAP